MDSNSNSKSKIGVLLVGHGSRLPYGEEVINGLAEIYRQQADYPVMVGFMNMNKPSIPKAINELSRNGVEKIIVTPVFLAHGVHTKQDIPHILGLDNGHEKAMDMVMITATRMKKTRKFSLKEKLFTLNH